MRATLAALLACTAMTALAGTVSAPASTIGQVYKSVHMAVVEIHVSGHEVDPERAGGFVRADSLGSGVLIAADGKVLTAAHVVQTADTVNVEFTDGSIVSAKVVAADVAADVALLQLWRVPPQVKPVPLGNSDLAEVGDEVFVVGAPFGISHTVTFGHLSARRKPEISFGGLLSGELFQTDAAINHGNSGGPMFNRKGEVIGVVSHIVSRSGGSEGLGFAVTSNVVRHLLLDEKSVWSGLDGWMLTGLFAQAFNLPARSGLLVQHVAINSPAARIGLRGGMVPAVIDDQDVLLGGDVLLAVAGIGFDSATAYDAIRARLVALRAAGEPVHLSVLRGGEILDLAGATGP
jgi:S1-C subfamily serine protease